LAEEASSLFNRHTAYLANVLAFDFHLARFHAQASPAARGAQRVSAIAAEKNADVQLVLLALKILKKSADAAETVVAIDDQLLLPGIQFVPGHVQGNSGLAREALEFGEQRPVLWLGPGLDRAFIQGFALVGDDEVEIDIDGVAEALATWAGAIRVVELKTGAARLFVAAAVILALEALGKTQALGSLAIAITIPKRGFENHFAGFAIADLDRIDDARALVGGDDEAIDQTKHGFEKLTSSSDSGVENSKTCPF